VGVVTCMAHYFAEPSSATRVRVPLVVQYVTNVFVQELDGDRYVVVDDMFLYVYV